MAKLERLTRGQMDEALNVVVAGIPALVFVERLVRVKGSFSRDAPSDLDFYGYVDLEYYLYDRKGYRAEWLERKLSESDLEEIESRVFRKGGENE